MHTIVSIWEGRVTVGINPETGAQKQQSVTGKTQKEVAQRMKEIAVEVDKGTYRAPTKMTVAEWADTWLNTYNKNDVKASTADLYKRTVELYIKPKLGKVKLTSLTPRMVQNFFNSLGSYVTRRGEPLSPKTIKNICGILHKLLKQAVDDKEIAYNPVDGRKTPLVEKKEASYMEEDTQAEFIKAVRGHRHEYLFLAALFTGMRQGELLALTWDCVDFDKNLILVKQSLTKASKKSGELGFSSTKNHKSRTITVSPSVIKFLRLQKLAQNALRIKAGDSWIERNLVFSNSIGDYLSYRTVYDCFKRVEVKIGAPDVRFHDLRHTYAANCICAGDHIKTLQKNMGHATSAFTMDVYGHVFDKMRKRSANRTEAHIQSLLAAAK